MKGHRPRLKGGRPTVKTLRQSLKMLRHVMKGYRPAVKMLRPRLKTLQRELKTYPQGRKRVRRTPKGLRTALKIDRQLGNTSFRRHLQETNQAAAPREYRENRGVPLFVSAKPSSSLQGDHRFRGWDSMSFMNGNENDIIVGLEIRWEVTPVWVRIPPRHLF